MVADDPVSSIFFNTLSSKSCLENLNLNTVFSIFGKLAKGSVVKEGKLQKCKCSVVQFISAEMLTEVGDPKQAITEAVEKLNIKLLVLGSHSRGAIQRAFLGSVSNYCVHNAKCPVLGGCGYHWLMYWEALCFLHFISNVFTSALFCILYGVM